MPYHFAEGGRILTEEEWKLEAASREEQKEAEATSQKRLEESRVRLQILREMLEPSRTGYIHNKAEIMAMITKDSLLDGQILRHYGVELPPGLFTKRKTFTDDVIAAIDKFDSERRHGAPIMSVGMDKKGYDARKSQQKAEDAAWEGYSYTTESLAAGAGASATRLFTGDPEKIAAGAKLLAATAGALGPYAMREGNRGTYSPEVEGPGQFGNPVGPWRYSGHAPTAAAPKPPTPGEPTVPPVRVEPPAVMTKPDAVVTATPPAKPEITAHADSSGVAFNEVKPADVTKKVTLEPAPKVQQVEPPKQTVGQRRYVPAPKPQPKVTTTPPPPTRVKPDPVTARPTSRPTPPEGSGDIFEQTGISETKSPGGKAPKEKTEAGLMAHKYYENVDDMIQDFAANADKYIEDVPRGPHVKKEFTIEHPAGRKPRIDRLDEKNAKIYEIKPNTPESIAKGRAQAQQYAEWMNRYHKRADGKVWEVGENGGVITYNQNALLNFLKAKGYLAK
jgi:hypothetical protein